MKIEIAAGSFDLENDTKIAVSLQNPLLNDQGSYSYPFSVPATKHNQALCNMPGHLEKAYYSAFSEPVKVECQGYELGGTLKVNACNSEKIELNLEANEGAFWSKVKKLKLTELDFGGNRLTPSGQATAAAWLNYFNAKIKEDKRYPQTDYGFFPVCTQREEDDGNTTYSIINPIAHDTPSDPNGYRLSGIYNCRNVSPFLWLNTVIDYLASHFNLRIVRNDLRTDGLASVTAVLHNNVGSITNGFLNYAHLVPDCSVEEFIEAVELRFGCCFFFDYAKGELAVIQYKNILSAQPAMDLTRYLASEMKITPAEGKPVKLKAGNSFDRAATSGETEADFTYVVAGTVNDKASLPATGGEFKKQAWFVKREGVYYGEVAGDSEDTFEVVSSYAVVSSALFAAISKTADEYESRESKEEQMVTFQMPEGDMAYQKWPFYNTGFVQRSGTNFYLKNTAESTPVSFCPYLGMVEGLLEGHKVKYPCGSTEVFSLPEMFNRYYTEYAAWKERSCKTVTASFKLPASVLAKLNYWEVYTVKGQPFILNTLPVALSQKGVDNGEVTMVTVKDYL
jgi:hypothetical protein